MPLDKTSPATCTGREHYQKDSYQMSLPNFEQVAPVTPIAPYLGGKSKLADTIIPLIEQIPHTTYAEPFIGMGGIFLRRRLRPKSEVVNDYNKELITLFRILQRHYPQFIDTLKFQVTSRAAFDRLRQTDPETLTDLERAARFLYLQKIGFGGKVNGKYAIQTGRAARFDNKKIETILEDFHERLCGVTIECKSYEQFIALYDRPDTLFYLDPPYWGCEKDYGKDCFYREDFTIIRDLLRDLKGKFILSLNNLPEAREHFAEFQQKTVETTYSLCSTESPKTVSELIISNTDLDFTPAQSALF